jgi:hypothetical protein
LAQGEERGVKRSIQDGKFGDDLDEPGPAEEAILS